ncbi:MAG TPA: hypothetical protein VH575_04600, partial [Gemmataceae bacterium]
MVPRTLPRRLYSWVRRWWLKHRTPRRRPIVRFAVPTLKPLEERFAPNSFGVATPLEVGGGGGGGG